MSTDASEYISLDDDLLPLDPPLNDITELEGVLAMASLLLRGIRPCPHIDHGGNVEHATGLIRELRRNIRLTQMTLIREFDRRDSDWRMLLPVDLDKFGRMLCENGSGIARRVIKNALQFYHSHLQEAAKREFPRNPYSDTNMELGHVAACLIELWDDNESANQPADPAKGA